MDTKPDQQTQPEPGVTRDGAAITGQDKGPLRADGTTEEYTAKDNLHTGQQETRSMA